MAMRMMRGRPTPPSLRRNSRRLPPGEVLGGDADDGALTVDEGDLGEVWMVELGDGAEAFLEDFELSEVLGEAVEAQGDG
jgi:hypothetical protein